MDHEAPEDQEAQEIPDDLERKKYHEAKFLEERLNNLNKQAERAFLLQQIGSTIAFIIVSVGIVLAYSGQIQLAFVQGIGSIAVSLVTYLFYKQSNKANDDTNKFALISIKFNESWNIIGEALESCKYIFDQNARDASVKNVIEKQLDLALSKEVWDLELDAQKVSISTNNVEENE